jgi:hypothetical protein
MVAKMMKQQQEQQEQQEEQRQQELRQQWVVHQEMTFCFCFVLYFSVTLR